jgi:signal transduction histidine kinase
MKVPIWLQDTIAHRFVLMAILAVGVTLVLAALFNEVSGAWSQPSLDQTGLLNEAADILRVIDAAPPSLRPTLCRAGSTDVFRIAWYEAGSDVSESLAMLEKNQTSTIAKLVLAKTQRAAVVFSPTSETTVPSGLADDPSHGKMRYGLAVALSDHGWIVFRLPNRTWGLAEADRWAIRMMFLAMSIALVTAIAARQFSKPIERLADAVKQFGTNPQSSAIAETGPKELRQVIKTFNDMRAQIQTFVAHRTTMLAAISHDLRTPLTRIRLRGELIEDVDQQARLFRDVDEMQAMVDGALAFFRDDAVAEATTTLDLPHVIITIANDYADQDIDIVYTGPAHGLYRGRPFALKRALTNLIENALKYATPPEISLSREGGSWCITVSDRGPGIPVESHDRVFRPYHRLDKSRNRLTGGVGLGLTVAQAIVHGHGGRIMLSNRAGGGLEVRILLPVDPHPFDQTVSTDA